MSKTFVTTKIKQTIFVVDYWCQSITAILSIVSFFKQIQLEIWGRAQREAARRRKSNCIDNFGWFKFRGQQRHLANQSEKLCEIAPKFHLGGST